MKKLFICASIALAFATGATAAENVKATVHADKAGAKINKEIYGQFSEHLGSCIYGGLWVGEKSQIPNINGYRKDVFEALKALKVPVLRWPGGCFADDYHWMDGIGPKDQRPDVVSPKPFKDAKLKKNVVTVKVPAKSLIVLNIK